jgi:ribulose-phosphate 3-epimerase
LRKQLDDSDYSCLIQVDGGINASNIHDLKAAGADLFVIGTHLYNSSDIKHTLETVLNKISGE